MADQAIPSKYLVMVTVGPTTNNGLKEAISFRVKGAPDIESCKKVIEEDLREMNKTYYGFIDAAGTTDRTYRVFEANWQEVTNQVK